MAVVVIGGHSRDVGKTSVVAGLIAALPEFGWTALKITQYGHGVCSMDGEACHCATDDHTWAIDEEKDKSGKTDTSRFLVAGAEHAWWVRTEQGRLAEAMPTIRNTLAGAKNTILESNSVLKFIRPDLYLTVLDPAKADFKKSAQEFLDRADAVVIHGQTDGNSAVWKGISLKPVSDRPIFSVCPPNYVTPEIIEFVKARLASAGSQAEP